MTDPIIVELRSALVECIESLEAHIRDDAKREGVSIQEYCPCEMTTLKRARAAVLKATQEIPAP